MKELTTKEGREKELKVIEDSFLSTLRMAGLDIATDAVCSISKGSIELGISSNGSYKEKGFKMSFASEITIYIKSEGFGRDKDEINFGSSGCFTPKEKASYWRTIHAASFLKNWDLVCIVVNEHCKMYSSLEKEIFKVNKQR